MIQQKIKESLIALATISGKELNEVSLTAYVDALSDIDGNLVLKALSSWLKTERGFPYPSDIRAKVMPEINDNDQAVDAVNRIISAVSKYGYNNKDKAREYIGELGFETVTRFGGWVNFCQTLTKENEGVFRAQLKELAKVLCKKSLRNELEHAPALPTSEIKNLITNTFKSIE